MKKMLTLAWDVDDVLNDFMRLWFERCWLPKHKDSSLTYENLTENPPHRLLGLSESDYLSSLDAFRLSESCRNMTPVPEVVSWFKKKGEQFRHIALTARSFHTVPIASRWVLYYFGKWIRSFHFIPAKREGQIIPAYDQSKAEFLHWFEKVDVLVDDSGLNIDMARAEGIEGILFPRPWNKNKNMAIDEALKALNE